MAVTSSAKPGFRVTSHGTWQVSLAERKAQDLPARLGAGRHLDGEILQESEASAACKAQAAALGVLSVLAKGHGD